MIFMWAWEAASDRAVLGFESKVVEDSYGGFMTRIVTENLSQSSNRFENSMVDTR